MTQDIELLRASLRGAVDFTPPDDISEKTRREMTEGRRQIVKNIAAAVADAGGLELERRFGKKAIAKCSSWYDHGAEIYLVSLTVVTATKMLMTFEEPLLEFPSDQMIAQIALVT